MVFFRAPRKYRMFGLSLRGGECESVVYWTNTHNACEPFAFNRRQLLLSSSRRAERVSCAGNCWSSQEGSSAAALSVDGYKLPNGTTGSPTHSGPRESDPARRARAAELLPAPAVLITRCVRTSDTTSRCEREVPGRSMLARSLASCFWAPLGAAHSHDNHLLTSSAFKSVLASDQSRDKQLSQAPQAPRSRK